MNAAAEPARRRRAQRPGGLAWQAASICVLLALGAGASFQALASDKADCRGTACAPAGLANAKDQDGTLAPATFWASWVATYYQTVQYGKLIGLCSGIQLQANWVLTARSCLNVADDDRTATTAEVAFSTGAPGNPAADNTYADLYFPPGGGDIMLLKLRSPHTPWGAQYAPVTFNVVNYPLFPATVMGYRNHEGYDKPVLIEQNVTVQGLINDPLDSTGHAMLAVVPGGCDLQNSYDKGGPLLADGSILGILSRHDDSTACFYTLLYPYQDWIRQLVPGL